MQISSLLEDKEIVELQQKFYEYFETGYAFEEFLKEYLLKMGLDEVEVTQRSGDGGIDLKAIRKGVGDFSEIDTTKYHIQAKRYNPKSSNIPPKDVQALRGTLYPGYKGIFITTSSFSKKANEDSLTNTSIPIVLVDGKALVCSCIDNEIGFVYKPLFSEEQMDKFLKKAETISKTIDNNIKTEETKRDYIDKMVSANDIKARILRIPKTILNYLEDSTKANLLVNNDKFYEFNIDKSRTYFGGVTKFFKDYQIINDDGTFVPQYLKWFYDTNKKIIYLQIEV